MTASFWKRTLLFVIISCVTVGCPFFPGEGDWNTEASFSASITDTTISTLADRKLVFPGDVAQIWAQWQGTCNRCPDYEPGIHIVQYDISLGQQNIAKGTVALNAYMPAPITFVIPMLDLNHGHVSEDLFYSFTATLDVALVAPYLHNEVQLELRRYSTIENFDQWIGLGASLSLAASLRPDACIEVGDEINYTYDEYFGKNTVLYGVGNPRQCLWRVEMQSIDSCDVSFSFESAGDKEISLTMYFDPVSIFTNFVVPVTDVCVP